MKSLLLFICYLYLAPTLSVAQEALVDFGSKAGWEKGKAVVVPVSGREGNMVKLRFRESDQRLVARNHGKWNLGSTTCFRFRVGIDHTKPLLEASLFFRSGNGGYRKTFTLSEHGFHHVLMPRAEFKVEGSPIGWGRIDAIEFTFWPRTPGTVILSSPALEGFDASTWILDPEPLARDGNERYTARVSRRHHQRILEGLGIPYALVKPDGFASSSRPDLVILPTLPHAPASLKHTLFSWMDSGTGVIAFGVADSQLASRLGVLLQGLVSSTSVGQFDRMRPTDVRRGQVFQHLWSVHNASAKDGGEVMARWGDAQGASHDLPAIIHAESGAWINGEWKSGDLRAKQNWMSEWVSTFSPASLEQSVLFFKETLSPSQIQEKAGTTGKPTPAARMLQSRAEDLYTAGLTSNDGLLAHKLFRRSRSMMERSLASSLEPWPAEVRGIWDQQGTGFYAGGWDETATTLKDAGFNVVFANMATAGRAHYRSSLNPPSKTFEKYGDQLQAFTQAAKRHGIQAHAWKICWKLNTRLPAFEERMKREGRLMMDPKGNIIPWLSLSDPRNVRFEIDSLLEMARSADLDGLHLDYMRYPGAEADYGPAAQKAFEKQLGRSFPNWPGEVLGPLKEEYQRFRQQQVHQAMEHISTAIRAEFPELTLSVAVWGAWPDCSVNQGQDWPVWCENGWVDWIIPMNYTDNPDQFEGWLDVQKAQPGVASRLIPGIGLISTNAELEPLQLLDQLERVRERDLPGAVLYRLDSSLPERVFPFLRVWEKE